MEEANASNDEFTEIFIKVGRIQYLILALIITGFVIFGYQFINIWAGQNYKEAYIITCILMIPVTIPLIQNIGLSIIQAKNKNKNMIIILLIISMLNLLISIPLAKMYGATGSAIGTAIATIIGYIIIMNIYYYNVIHINIKKYWKEIIKMSIPIIILTLFGYILNLKIYNNTGIIILGIKIIIYTMSYIFIIWRFVMNNYEKNIIKKPLSNFKNRRK